MFPRTPSPAPGATFARLTVVRSAGLRDGAEYTTVACVCGRRRSVQTSRLVAGRTRSCGCLRPHGRPLVDTATIAPAGTVFGRLTVVSHYRAAGRPGRVGVRRTVCVCACGATHDARFANLLQGLTRSCGCLRREALAARRAA